jgi:pimeloyl-ACP methyl ester carboxylesterase
MSTTVHHSRPVDDFRLAYERHGSGPAVILLHGWPGDRTDFAELVPRLSCFAQVIVPDLRGFGASDKHDVANEAPDTFASAIRRRLDSPAASRSAKPQAAPSPNIGGR